MNSEQISRFIDTHAVDFENMSDKIWEYAEPAFKEFKSSKLQAEYLKAQGFQITMPLAGMDTAFQADYGSGKPVIAVLGEYDALPGLSQTADCTYNQPVSGQEAGHGCGHNLLGTAGVEAACAVKELIEQGKLKGTIRYYGCPAEEGGGGKVIMIRAGVFDDVDVAISWHPDMKAGLMSRSLSCVMVKYEFDGIASHASAQPERGRSALDAAELMNVGVQFLREHIPSHSRIHYAFEDAGGIMPNVVQDHAKLFYCVRSASADETNAIYERVCKIARGAAMMTETTLREPEITCAYSNIIYNETLSDLVLKHMARFYPVSFTEEEEAYGRSFLCGDRKGYFPDYLKSRDGVRVGTTDFGDVSWVIPCLGFRTACYSQSLMGHSWELTAQGKSSAAKKGMHMAGRLMAECAAELLESPELVAAARQDFEKELDGRRYKSLLPE